MSFYLSLVREGEVYKNLGVLLALKSFSGLSEKGYSYLLPWL